MDLIQMLYIWVALGVSYWLVSMAPYWEELLDYHLDDPLASLMTDVVSLVETVAAWPYFMYKDIFTNDESDPN